MALPRFVVLKTDFNHNKYLRYRNEDGLTNGFIQASGEQTISPLAKFEVVLAKSGNGKYVHIRCCYNNKYWVSWKETPPIWIFAGAEQPEEDQSKSSCTLFEPIFPDASNKTIVSLHHVKLGLNTYPARSTDAPYDGCLFAGTQYQRYTTVIDWESLVILPKYVAFKGNNGKYLSSHNSSFAQFSGSDIGEQVVGFEVFTCANGTIRLKSQNDDFQAFWNRLDRSSDPLRNNWIMILSDDTSCDNSNTLFWPVKISNNVIALRCVANDNFCKQHTGLSDYPDCFYALAPSMSVETHLQVEEPVVSRQIYNVNYRLADARIYNQTVLDMATAESSNTTTQDNTLQMRLKYLDSKTGHWNANLSLTLGAKTTFQTKIPFILDGQIEMWAEFKGSYEWGDEWTSSRELETTYNATVKPMTKVTVKLIATKGLCDVPFSYVTRDVLYDGSTQISEVDGGVYTGISCYNFQFDVQERSLQTNALLRARVLKV